MMIERTLIVAGALVMIALIITLSKRQQLKKAQLVPTNSNSLPTDNKKLQIIYFWSTQCGQCKTVQTPIINKLSIHIGEKNLKVSRYNISESIEKAKKWGVKTVPSTYILDNEGTVQHINNGLVTEKKLHKQIKSLY